MASCPPVKALLVYGECVCGWRCMCPEGATWPKCPSCGRQVLPPQPGGLERYGAAVELRPEQEALSACDRVTWQASGPVPRMYGAGELERDLESRGYSSAPGGRGVTLGEASAAYQQQLEVVRRALEADCDLEARRELVEDLWKAERAVFAAWMESRL